MAVSEDRPDRGHEMRNLHVAERRAAIDASPNVVGYDRFTAKHRRVQLSKQYR